MNGQHQMLNREPYTGNELVEYFNGRDKRSDVAPYVPQAPRRVEDSGSLLPRDTARKLVAVGVVSIFVSISAGIFTVVASGAANAFIGWGVGCGALLVVVSSFFGGGGNSKPKATTIIHNHYTFNQNNHVG